MRADDIRPYGLYRTVLFNLVGAAIIRPLFFPRFYIIKGTGEKIIVDLRVVFGYNAIE